MKAELQLTGARLRMLWPTRTRRDEEGGRVRSGAVEGYGGGAGVEGMGGRRRGLDGSVDDGEWESVLWALTEASESDMRPEPSPQQSTRPPNKPMPPFPFLLSSPPAPATTPPFPGFLPLLSLIDPLGAWPPYPDGRPTNPPQCSCP